MEKANMNTELIKALEESSLVESKNAINLITEGATVHSDSMPCDDSLLLTYTIRLKHIKSISSAHALRLAAATAEFVSRLKSTGSEGGDWHVIEGNDEYQFNVFQRKTGEVIGCLPVIPKNRVSEERWSELWEMPKA